MRRLLLLVPAAMLLSACGGDTSNESSSDGPVVTTIQISESEFSLTPRTITVPQAGTYEFDVRNDGQVTHALEIEGNGSEQESGDIGPGSTVTMRVALSDEGRYEMYCPIGNHRDQGMEGEIVVGKAAGSGGTTTGDDETTTSDDDSGGYYP
jgi:PQQ system protein